MPTPPASQAPATACAISYTHVDVLSRDEIDAYIGSGEWRGKAGGYAIQGIAGCFIVKLVGSYTNVVGLPLPEVLTCLHAFGVEPT